MEKKIDDNTLPLKNDIKLNENKIIVLEAKKIKLNQELDKLEKKTSKNLIEKTKIEHLKHELKSRSNKIKEHETFINNAKKQLKDI